ncbi:MAG: hypothetical protein D6730_09455 [Bacteroidetes bacterium]|nr:MAG: hypothetical protein D6730_09455 [Bacteroidota bacterium]
MVCFSLFCCWQLALPAQSCLVLSHQRKALQHFYYPGDAIRVQLKSDKSRHYGFIEAVTDSVLILQKTIVFPRPGEPLEDTYREWVPLHDIRLIYKDPMNTWDVCRQFFYAGTIMGGSALIGVVVINTLVFGVTPPIGAFIVVSGLLVSGIIVKYAGRDHYKIGKRWQLAVRESPLQFETSR